VDNLFTDIQAESQIEKVSGDLLADGTKAPFRKFGGEEFAIHSKGLEISAYEPRRSVGMGLGYATSNRGGCHLNGDISSSLKGLLSISTH